MRAHEYFYDLLLNGNILLMIIACKVSIGKLSSTALLKLGMNYYSRTIPTQKIEVHTLAARISSSKRNDLNHTSKFKKKFLTNRGIALRRNDDPDKVAE
jgi:hypothetical protein